MKKLPTLVVFGPALLFFGPDGTRSRSLADDADLPSAIADFIAEGDERPSSIDMLFAPAETAGLRVEPVTYPPRQSRKKLKASFTLSHPSLKAHDLTWCLTKPYSTTSDTPACSSILTYEQTPLIDRIVERLSAVRVRIHSILHPTAFFSALTSERKLDLAILEHEGFFLVYYANEYLAISLKSCRTHQAVAAFLDDSLGSRKSPPPSSSVLLVASGDLPELQPYLAARKIAAGPIAWDTWVESLSFSPKDCANLLNKPFAWRTHHFVNLAAIPLAVLALSFAARSVHGYVAAAQAARLNSRTIASLQAQIAKLQPFQDAAKKKEALLSVSTDNPKPSAFLDCFVTHQPPSIAIQHYHFHSPDLDVDGVYTGATPAAFQAFVKTLSNDSYAWRFRAPPILNGTQWSFHLQYPHSSH